MTSRLFGGRVGRILGRRGICLLFFALLSAVFALSLLNPSPTQAAALHPFPPQAWGGVWALTAVGCAVGAFVKRWDRVAYSAAGGVVAAWAMTYLAAWIVGTVPRGWLGATIYLALTVLIATIGTWQECQIASKLDAGYPDAVVTADETGSIVGWYGAAPDLFGWTAEQALGQQVSSLMPIRYRGPHQEAFERAAYAAPGLRREGRTVDVEALHADGHEIPVSVFITATPAGETLLYSAVIRRREPT